MFAILARESFQDAMPRRIVPVIAVVALFTLLAVDSCTSCGDVATINAPNVDVDVAGWAGMVLFTTLSIWIMALGNRSEIRGMDKSRGLASRAVRRLLGDAKSDSSCISCWDGEPLRWPEATRRDGAERGGGH